MTVIADLGKKRVKLLIKLVRLENDINTIDGDIAALLSQSVQQGRLDQARRSRMYHREQQGFPVVDLTGEFENME